MGMLNIASLPKHIDEIRIILADECLDILALNETRLDETINNQDMYISNYDLIRVDRSRTGGGAYLFVKTSLNYSERKDLTRDNLEAVCVEIHKPSIAPFIVGTIYRPPSASVDSFANIEQLVKTIDDENKEFYIIGDLNANMLDISNNATKNLNSIMELYQLSQTINTPTRVTTTSSSLLDVCLTPTPAKLITSRVIPTAISDHYMIYIVRKINIQRKQNCHKKLEIRNLKYFNAENFQADLRGQEWTLLDNNFCVDKMWDTWKTLFLRVLDRHAPIREKRVKSEPSVPWLTNAIKKQIHERDRLKSLAIKHKSENYWNAYKTSRNRVTDALRETKAAYYKGVLEKVKHDPKQAWKTVNKILNRKQECREINCLETQTGQISQPTELAECFNNYFTNIGPDIAKNIDTGDRNFTDYITTATSSFNFQTVSESNVYRLLLSLNPCKSTGIDKIPAKIIRIAAPEIANSLTKIFNTAIRSETVPFEWKIARVTPIYKNGPRNLLNNYRPISILPVVSKLFEKALYEQLYEYLVAQKLLSSRQFGFRKFHSTSSALLDSTNEWFINMDRGLFNIAVFLDLQKAFDTINHDILLTKLDLYGLQMPSLNLLGSYLSNRTQMCSVNGALSGTKLVTCGIPQGSILGPLLFLIYINDLPNSLEHSSARMFADDTTLTVSGKSIEDVEVAINHDLTNVKQWLSANRLSLNLVKTEYLLIGSRYNKNNLLAAPNVFVGDIPIKKVKETKALGVHIDEFLLWDKHIDKIAKKISSGIGAIRKLKSCVDHNTLVCAYNALVLPHLDYCCEVWDTIGVTLSDRLQKLQNRAARVITGRKNEHGQSELALNELKWKPLCERRTHFVASLMYKITHELAPKRLTDIFQRTSSSQYYNIRGSSTKLFLPKPKTEFLKKSLSYRGAKLWNSLSDEARNKHSLASFNSCIRHLAS